MLLDRIRLVVLEPFLRDYTARRTGSEIAKEKRLPQKSVANVLNELHHAGILEYKWKGRNKEFSLDPASRNVHVILAAEHLRTRMFLQDNQTIDFVLERILPHCHGSVAIFGSYAKGTQDKHSDIDVSVVGECNREAVRQIAETYRMEIQIFVYPRKLFREKSATDFLLKSIRKDHILLKGAETFVRTWYDEIARVPEAKERDIVPEAGRQPRGQLPRKGRDDARRGRKTQR